MPPKVRFTREEILAAALDIVRTQGLPALTARSLAQALGTTPKPIFGYFASMQELQTAVLSAADGLYQSYLHQDMAKGEYPAYKASGMAYIRFAREEKQLFQWLFMRDRTGEPVEENWAAIQPILDVIVENLGISQEEASLFHLENWIFVHGIATMIATGYLDWDMEFISRALSDVYQGLKGRYCREEGR